MVEAQNDSGPTVVQFIRRNGIDWKNLPIHPAAEAWPEMLEEQIAELAKDIVEHGLQVPMVVFEDNSAVVEGEDGPFPQYLLDGRSRKRALATIGITNPEDAKGSGSKFRVVRAMRQLPGSDDEPKWEPDTDPFKFVLTVNSHRLHLNTEMKRKAIEAALAANPNASNRDIARKTGTDHKTVGEVRDAENGENPQNPHLPLDRAKAALLTSPEKSNRAIAKDLGISDKTVGKAREELEAEGKLEPKTPPTPKTPTRRKGGSTPTRTKQTTRTPAPPKAPEPSKQEQELAETERTNIEVAAWLKEHAANEIPAWVTWLETMNPKQVIELLLKQTEQAAG